MPILKVITRNHMHTFEREVNEFIQQLGIEVVSIDCHTSSEDGFDGTNEIVYTAFIMYT